MSLTLQKTLFVDDDPRLLSAVKRGLRKKQDIETCVGGEAAIQRMEAGEKFSVLVTDMRMPGVDGLEVLRHARKHLPDAVRLMLTGNADQQTAINAVNQGAIFRFLNKPCSPEDLSAAIDAATHQYQLQMAEKELITKTLSGSVKVLTDTLSLANPAAFGQSTHVRRTVRELVRRLEAPDGWQSEIAAMLAPIGAIALPASLAKLAASGAPMSSEQRATWITHAEIGAQLVGNISRLEGAAKIIAYQFKDFDGGGSPDDDVSGEELPLGARILRVAADFENELANHHDPAIALGQLQSQAKHYDPQVLATLAGYVEEIACRVLSEKTFAELKPGMQIGKPVIATNGTTLVAAGCELTDTLLARLRKYHQQGQVDGNVQVWTATGLCPG